MQLDSFERLLDLGWCFPRRHWGRMEIIGGFVTVQ